MTSTTTGFDELQAAAASGGAQAVLDRLAEQLLAEKKFHELLEARKMQVRGSLGLPYLSDDGGGNLDDAQREKLEDGLFAACREVGLELLGEGKVREGWMYMRPVGDNEAARAAIAEIEVDEDNLDDIVEVTLNEGVDVTRGYGLVLEHYGTCNAITTFESVMPHHSKDKQQATAAMLVRHLHDELTATVRADIAQQQGSEPAEQSLRELVADRDWLFGENSYHVDTTHLASAVRFGRLLDDPEVLRIALDLTEYGRRLNEMFQHSDNEPFADTYPAHALYFEALLGENVDAAIDYFRQKATTVDIHRHGTSAVEVYIDLLSRVGRHQEALQAATTMFPDDAPSVGIAPSLLVLSEKAGNYDALMEYYRTRNNLLGYATGLIYADQKSSHP